MVIQTRAGTHDPGGTVEAVGVPALENGDRLSRPEFERRYEAMTHLKKAELIEGVVYVPSPVRYTRHGHPDFHMHTWLDVYQTATPGTSGATNTTVRLDLDNEPQPDILLRIEWGGTRASTPTATWRVPQSWQSR